MAAAAAIVAVSLVSAPKPITLPIQPLHLPAIQLQSLATAMTPPGPAAAAIPRASVKGPTPQNVFDAAVTVALTPLWYTAFPVTLPGSIAFAWILYFYASGVGGWQTPIKTADVVKLGLATFLLGPITYVQGKLSALVPKANPSSTAARPRGTSSLAGSRRTTQRPPTTHRVTEKTPAAASKKKRSGIAGSGRSARP